MVVNGSQSAFEIDLFQNLIVEIKKQIGDASSPKNVRIISDHIRASAFLISDGILPSNEGRGYILRRLLRRALREGWTEGKREPFLFELAGTVAQDMGKAYPDLPERLDNIRSIIKTEEENFLSTIEAGTKNLEVEIRKSTGKTGGAGKIGKVQLTGEKVFQIYDTYGLGKEIQAEIVSDWGGELIYSEDEYDSAREKAVTLARKGWKGSGEADLTLYALLHKKLGNTLFKAYDSLELNAKILAIVKNHKEADQISQGEEGEIILSETPFYAESGGQVGDKGSLDGAQVLDTQRPYEGLITHHVQVIKDTLKVGDTVRAAVDTTLRDHTMRHHTATHLLHAALRKLLGSQVTQAGSKVSPEKLRFDFSFLRALEPEEIAALEEDVTDAILRNIPRKRTEEPLEEARKMGALAFFGDKYGAKVFVLKYGDASTEVCGGTHCETTGDIKLFKIMSQRSVGSGLRRIEAVAGEKARDFIIELEKNSKEEKKLKEKSSFPKNPRQDPADIDALINTAVSLPSSKNEGVKILAQTVKAENIDQLRETADHVRNKLGSGIVILASCAQDKISFVVTLTPSLKEAGYHAGKIAKALAEKIGGSGGGKYLFAQGGGKFVPNLKEILESFPKELAL